MAGHALRWSAWENKRKTGQATLPVGHDGRFNRAELKFDQDLYCALPAKEDMKPAMVFTFELFMLRGDLSPFDRVVAWGAFPICNEHFDIVQGKCKVPMLRGPMRQNIDRFSKIQTLMHKDLDNWLANLYFEVKLLPKYKVVLRKCPENGLKMAGNGRKLPKIAENGRKWRKMTKIDLFRPKMT